MTRLLQTCHSESPSWAVLSRTQGPVNTPNIQSHRPVSPAMLFKHLLKLTLFCNVNSLRTTLLGLLLHYMCCGTSTQKRKGGKERKRVNEKGTQRREEYLRTVEVAPQLSSSPCLLHEGSDWDIDQPNSEPFNRTAPMPLTCCLNPPKLDYWDPRSKAYITSTCETLAGLITLNGNVGQIKAGWPVCTLSLPTDGWWKATWDSMADDGGIVGWFPFWAPIGPGV